MKAPTSRLPGAISTSLLISNPMGTAIRGQASHQLAKCRRHVRTHPSLCAWTPWADNSSQPASFRGVPGPWQLLHGAASMTSLTPRPANRRCRADETIAAPPEPPSPPPPPSGMRNEGVWRSNPRQSTNAMSLPKAFGPPATIPGHSRRPRRTTTSQTGGPAAS